MSAPQPSRLRRSYGTHTARDQANVPGEISILVEMLLADYAYAYGQAYDRTRTGELGMPRGGSVSNPTKETALDPARQALRSRLYSVSDTLRRCLKDLESETNGLKKALARFDPPASSDLKLTDQYRISRAELQESKEAARRRADRGEVAV